MLELTMFLNLPILGSTSSGLIISCSSLNDIRPLSLFRRFLCSVLSPVVAMTTRLLWAVLNSVRSSNSFSFSIPGREALEHGECLYHVAMHVTITENQKLVGGS